MKSALRCLFVFWIALALFAGESADKVWISFDGDAVPAAQKVLAARGMKLRLDHFRSGDGIAVAQVARAALPVLGVLFHEQFNRCGGYLVHEDALAAHTVKTQQALRRQTTAKAQRVAYSIDRPTEVAALLDEVDEDQVLAVIQQFSSFQNRFYDTQSGVNAAVWLRDTWLGLADGLQGVSAELYTHSFPQPSVILTIQGSQLPDEIVVLGAHLDSTSISSLSPGADDDASGIACLTEVLRSMAATGFQPARTVKFMGYAGEEHGLLGSQAIAGAYATAGRNVVGVLQLDMTNYQGSTQDIWMIQDYTNGPQNTFITQLANTYLPELTVGTTSCGYGCSDHASWHTRGFPASLPFEARFGQYNPFIHSANDTLAASGNHAQHAVKFARLAACYLVELAKGGLSAAPPHHQTRVDLSLLLTVQAAIGSCGLDACPMDLDGDGDVDAHDVALLYPEWAGESCLDFGEGPACPAQAP